MSKLIKLMHKIEVWKNIDKDELLFENIERKLHNSLLNYNRRLKENLDRVINNMVFMDEIKTLKHINTKIIRQKKRR